MLKCHMFTCVPTSSMRLLGWARLDSHHSSGRETEQTDSYSCSSWERAVANKLSLCLTSNVTQLWASSHGLRRVTHTQMHTLGRCCRGYSVCAHSGIHTHVQLFTCALHCSYQMLDHRRCTRRKVVSWKIIKPFDSVGCFAGFAFCTCSFIIFSFCLCCSAMWRESNPADRYYTVSRLSWALPKQPELRMEDHRARGNGNPGILF